MNIILFVFLEMDEQRKTQPPVVKYHLRRHVWDIKKKDQLKAMFWRRSFSDQISNETSDMMNKLQKIVQQKKNLFNMEVLLNKRFMLPKLPSIVNMKLEPSKMKKLLMKNFPSLYYPGRSTSLSYYPYEPILQRHTMWGTRPEIAVPWVPRYHRVYKTHLLPYGEGLPETIQIMRSNPIKSTRTENLKKFFYPERGDVGKVIA